MLSDEIRKAVRRGVERLDEKDPGWAKRIDPKAIDMVNVHRCVLGRLYGGYEAGLEILGITPSSMTDPGRLFGFSMEKTFDRDWNNLTEIWREHIRIRRNA